MKRWRRLGLAVLAAVCATGSTLTFAKQSTAPDEPGQPSAAASETKAHSGANQPQPAADPELIAQGRALFEEGCVSCHGFDAKGIEGVAPSLEDAGAAAADFYLSTGRMPLNDPDDQPVRADPRYDEAETAALVAYVGSLGGPPIPDVDPSKGSIQEGVQAFATHCAGCHQAVARGGSVGSDAFAPSLLPSTPTQVAEAARIGPYVMPVFPERVISDSELNSIAAYVELTKHPVNEGGWGIGNIGPIPEGMVAWFLAIVALLAISRLIGERIDQ